MLMVLGILAGIVLPVQTSINGNLRKRLGSPYYASLVSFVVALLFLLILLPVTGQNYTIPFAEIAKEPIWIWFGGICGVTFLTGNILLIANLDGVQTVVLPILGQIVMGLVIDTFGLFHAEQINMSIPRILGVMLVLGGVIIVSLAKSEIKSCSRKKQSTGIWKWRIFGVITGMVTAMQAAFNGRLGKVTGSVIKASVISFCIGIIFLLFICITARLCSKNIDKTEKNNKNKFSWWIWTGGILGGIYILANVSLTGAIGVGTTVIALLSGSTLGGLLVDYFGLFGCEKKTITLKKVIGVVILIAGAAMIKLF